MEALTTLLKIYLILCVISFVVHSLTLAWKNKELSYLIGVTFLNILTPIIPLIHKIVKTLFDKKVIKQLGRPVTHRSEYTKLGLSTADYKSFSEMIRFLVN